MAGMANHVTHGLEEAVKTASDMKNEFNIFSAIKHYKDARLEVRTEATNHDVKALNAETLSDFIAADFLSFLM